MAHCFILPPPEKRRAFYSMAGRIAAFLAVFSLAGCRVAPVHGQPSPLPLSPRTVRLDVPYQSQDGQELCGLAAVGMLTAYYGRPLAPAALAALRLQAQAERGLSGEALKAALTAGGYDVEVFAGTLDHQPQGLYHHLDLKRPCLVMTGAAPRHYAVAVGYDPGTGVILLLDPAQGPLTVPWRDLIRPWDRAHDFTLLAVPR